MVFFYVHLFMFPIIDVWIIDIPLHYDCIIMIVVGVVIIISIFIVVVIIIVVVVII